MGKITLEVSDTDIAFYVSSLKEQRILDIVKLIDVESMSWNLTHDLAEYFIKEIKNYFDSKEEYEAFLDNFKE